MRNPLPDKNHHRIRPAPRRLFACGGAVVVMVADTVPLWLRRLKLTDKQWCDIQRASGLPDAGRWQIEHALAVYAALRAVSVQPASKTRKELRELVELADNLMTAAKQLTPGAFAALMPPAPQEILAAAQVAASGAGTPKRDAWQQFAAWSKAAFRATWKRRR